MNDSAKLLSPARSSCRGVSVLWLACAALALVALTGCANKQVDTAPTVEPGATFTGESYLRGTVSSYGQLLNHQSLLVSGFGMVVDLIPHMFGANQRPTGERALYCYWRNGSGLIDGNAMRLLNIATSA